MNIVSIITYNEYILMTRNDCRNNYRIIKLLKYNNLLLNIISSILKLCCRFLIY